MASLFPIFLKLDGRKCLVVGGGRIAGQKVPGLLESGADVVVVATEAIETIRTMAHDRRLSWEQRPFEARDLDGKVLVIAATANRPLNAEVYRLAQERGVLCNAVDEPENCDFYYPSVVKRGDLQVAISTNGKSPALAQRLRAELDAQLPRDYEGWVAWLGRLRARLFRRSLEVQRRVELLHSAASRKAYERFARRHSREVQA